MALDPDERAELEEQRDFLLESLADLDRELEAGDIDEADHRTLRADYTVRAAEVLRALGETRPVPEDGASSRPGRGRRVATVAGVLVLAVVAGALVMQASGRRAGSGPTGLDVRAASSRVDDCQALDQSGDADEALRCYSDVLESVPGNVSALTFRGWLQIREFEIEDGLDDLDAAIDLAPDTTAAHVFRASGRSRSGDAPGAVADLAAFYRNNPSEEERALADQFVPVIVDAALDTCIGGDVDASMAPVEVLQCYRDVLEVDPGNPSASIYLGWLLARSGLVDEALALLDDGLRSDPAITAGYVFRAALRAHLGDVDGARADLAAFEERDPPDDQIAAARQVRQAIEAGEDPLPS